GGAEEAVGQFTQQGAALGAGVLLGQGDQVGQARAGLFWRQGGCIRGRGGDGGSAGHGSNGSSMGGAARRRPAASRIRVGASGGAARSVEAGVWSSSTGMASR